MTGSFVILCILFCTFKNILLRRGPQASSEYTVQFMAQKITAHLVHQDLSLASLIQITTKKLEIFFSPYILINLSKLQWLKYIFIETAYCEIIKDFREFPGGQWLGLFLSLLRAQVQSLVGELKSTSHMDMVWPKKKNTSPHIEAILCLCKTDSLCCTIQSNTTL